LERKPYYEVNWLKPKKGETPKLWLRGKTSQLEWRATIWDDGGIVTILRAY